MGKPVSWEDQGREEVGRFGDGKGPDKSEDTSGGSGMFGTGGLAQRIQAVAYGTIGALPQVLRARASAQYGAGTLARQTEAMTAWSGGTQLSKADFADRFFGRTADDPVAENLLDAALDVRLATSHAELRDAAEKVANAMQAIGLDRWPRFLADAQDRARDPETIAAVEKSRQLRDPGRDAIRPVYPVGTLLGIGAAGIVGGVAAAARVAGGAILRQVLPKASSRTGGSAAEESADEAVNAEKPLNAGKEGSTPTELKRPSLPASPDDLLAQAWKETTHPKAGATGHRTFVNPKTGQTVEFDSGRPGQAGWRGKDHYHIINPDATGDGDLYLDQQGRPVPNGSKPSHIPPDR
jgi:hypothetical protein